MTDIIMQAYQVLDEIKNDPMYQAIKSFDQMIIRLYQDEITKFQEAKKAYDQIMNEGGTYHPDYKETIKLFSQAKSELYQKPEVVTYFELERQFQDELNAFLTDLSRSVSNHITTPNKLGIVTKGGSCHVR
ncbi:MAG: YlbF family regulator [Acholeplasmataceae bacterium]|nr:YlbF family regulator [Acholeplasmataceae bacterium]